MNSETDSKKTTLSTSFGGTVEKDIPENVEWIDDAFYIKKTRFGLFTSILKNPLGQHFITGATEDGVIIMSRWHLICVFKKELLMTTAKLLTVASLEVNSDAFFGGLFQLVEHLLCKQGVSGSSPLFSIHKYLIRKRR